MKNFYKLSILLSLFSQPLFAANFDYNRCVQKNMSPYWSDKGILFQCCLIAIEFNMPGYKATVRGKAVPPGPNQSWAHSGSGTCDIPRDPKNPNYRMSCSKTQGGYMSDGDDSTFTCTYEMK